MHIPDGYLSPEVWSIMFFISLPILIFSIYRLKSILNEKLIPLLGMSVATIFALQMVNYPLGPGGTTGHLIGAPLLGILFGPYVGIVGISMVLLIQALLFGDGGITTYGANVFNMAIIGSVIGYVTYKLFRRFFKGDSGIMVSGAIAGWLGITCAAFFCGLELGFSYETFGYGLSVTIPVMTISHAILGVVEGIVTGAALLAFKRYRPDIFGG